MDAPEAQKTLMKALEDFTSRENWDDFFKIRSDKPFEWYGEWSNLAEPLAQHCALHSSNGQLELDILIPGCGNSELSEKLYDAGFKRITNIDFSKVVIGNMLRKYLRTRPGMIWRVMDMTNMQFSDGTFDVVLDKGGLDALMEPKLGPKLGIQFLSEVKRVLRKGGKYVCISLVQTHVIELLFSTFRCGWKVTVHPILQHASLVQGLFETIAKENKLRKQHTPGEDLLNDLKDLEIGAKDGMKQLLPGRRMNIMLGEHGISRFNYRAVIMDSYERFGPFSYSCGVFLVPKARANEWIFSSEEGQWQIVENAKAGRLIMVFLDEYHSCIGLEAVQKDLSPLVGGLAPEKNENGSKIPYMMASDGVVKRTIVQEVVSPLTGRIIVEDVCTENSESDNLSLSTKNEIFRRLVFERCPGLIQSEALLKKSESLRKDEKMKKAIDYKHHLKSKKKKNRRIGDSGVSAMQEPKANLHVDHYYLASLYHGAMITGFGLILSKLENWILSKMLIRTVVIGLGAGLLPMFLHKRMPFLQIEAVELDPIVANLAKEFFGFIEDERMKLHIGDGVKMVDEMAKISKSTGLHDISLTNSIESEFSQANAETSIADVHTSFTMGHESNILIEDRKGVHVLIIDVDSDDLSTGLSCPHSSFVEESFLRNAKESLCIDGILILNLVSRSATVHKMVISRMETVFEELFSLEIEEDVNKILFALPKKSCISTDGIVEGVARLVKLLESSSPRGNGPNIEDFARKIRCVK
ncbi:uncharacterized protein LOC131047991 isoform X2 [Cryptomeria japonica]|uniref:uncharacterized protein LOC131047991 isoform X2 n=1 Tax=Cryptomeria japonica TaxID=3369 RepID=UPI0025AD62B6|nr:uncharacterized protein LOC131047991 isoform X2 [Cryptomeria japonica]